MNAAEALKVLDAAFPGAAWCALQRKAVAVLEAHVAQAPALSADASAIMLAIAVFNACGGRDAESAEAGAALIEADRAAIAKAAERALLERIVALARSRDARNEDFDYLLAGALNDICKEVFNGK